MGIETSWAHTRLKVLEDFNLAGREGAERWGRFIRLCQQAGFTEMDFRGRVNASRRTVEQWSHNAGCPPETQRQQYRHVIVEILKQRLDPKPL